MTSNRGEVDSVNVSAEKGTPKGPVGQIVIDERGVVGDAHAGAGHRLVSLLSRESIDGFSERMGRAMAPGEFAENVTTRGLDLARDVALLDRFQVGPACLEVTQLGKECHGEGCAIFREVGRCVMPTDGIFCRVLRGGVVRPGDPVEHVPCEMRFQVITLSDRAARGEYANRSGPELARLLEGFAREARLRARVERRVLPDDAEALRDALMAARREGVGAVFTSGGTGVGPRDVTPEVVESVCDKTIPGIMEAIRVKYGAENPRALLSRSVAGVMGTTLVYALPGSVRAVREYMAEILPTLRHLLLIVRGIDAH